MSAAEFNDASMNEKVAAAATDHDFPAIVDLVGGGASPDSSVPGFGTLLIYAVTQGQQELAEFLVGRGASVDRADDAGNTPLMHAARLCLPDIVSSLLERDASPLLRNNDGKNAFEAARAGAKSLTDEFNDTSMAVEDLENSIKVDYETWRRRPLLDKMKEHFFALFRRRL